MKRVWICLLCLCLLLTFSACGAPATEESGSQSQESSSESGSESESSSSASQEQSGSESGGAPEAMSYEEFFSVRRVEDFMSETTGLYVFICDDNATISQEERQGLTEGYLYAKDLETEEISLLAAQPVTSYAKRHGKIYFTSGSGIYSVDPNGENLETVLEETGELGNLRMGQDLMFFTIDQQMYRCYLPTKTVDLVGDVTGMAGYEPVSNIQVAWWKNDNEAYIINIKEGTQTQVPINSWGKDREVLSLLPSPPFNASVNGVALPLPEYPHGSYFTTTDTACSHRDGIAFCKEYEGSIQSEGFAKYVYAQLFGSADNGTLTEETVSFDTEEAVQEFFGSLQPGSRVRLRMQSENLDQDHWVLFVGAKGKTVSVYDANASTGKCEVAYRVLSLSDVMERYSCASAWFSPSEE